jgi:hypothetical protein
MARPDGVELMVSNGPEQENKQTHKPGPAVAAATAAAALLLLEVFSIPFRPMLLVLDGSSMVTLLLLLFSHNTLQGRGGCVWWLLGHSHSTTTHTNTGGSHPTLTQVNIDCRSLHPLASYNCFRRRKNSLNT